MPTVASNLKKKARRPPATCAEIVLLCCIAVLSWRHALSQRAAVATVLFIRCFNTMITGFSITGVRRFDTVRPVVDAGKLMISRCYTGNTGLRRMAGQLLPAVVGAGAC